MPHAHHFLSRLDRLSVPHVELALALYRDDERLRYVLEQAHVPEGAERVALSLDDPREGPFMLVTHTGRFVTCLARGMRTSDVPIVTRAELADCPSGSRKKYERCCAAACPRTARGDETGIADLSLASPAPLRLSSPKVRTTMKSALLAWLRGRPAHTSKALEITCPSPDFAPGGIAVTAIDPRVPAVPTHDAPGARDPRDRGAGPAARSVRLDAAGLPMLDVPERYEDLGLLGRGGMGAVREVRDLVLRREVAVKLLDASLAGHPAHMQGFVEEARIGAQLDHPNIPPVHELGSDHAGTIYFTMKRVRGTTLHALLQDPALPPGSSDRLAIGLEVMLKVCDAMEFAHSRGVLHRDIKPANIMVGGYGEVFLMDWGLAKVQRAQPGAVDVPRDPASALGRAREGAVGTPSFMPPEMARAEVDRVDERSDVFGLGAVLYAIVTGRAPFEAEGLGETLLLAGTCAVTPPDQLGGVFVPKRLSRIVMKALAPEPEDRYPTVTAFAESVREFVHRGLYLPRQTFTPGQKIVTEGEVGASAYIVTSGRCTVYKTVGGERRVLREMGPDSLFGEAAVLGAAARTATVEALTDVTVLVITQEALGEGLGSGTWESLMVRTLVERFRELDAKLP